LGYFQSEYFQFCSILDISNYSQSNDGILGFSHGIHVQFTPIQIPELKKITSLCAGANHILALDSKKNVFAWGSGQQNQLGRRVVERTRAGGLVPREFGLPRGKIDQIASGGYHSFALDNSGRVWAWGLNNFGECGISEGAGEDNAVIARPTIVDDLKSYNIREIRGGSHHSLACTHEGQLLAWGRSDGGQLGVDISKVPKENLVFDERDRPRMVKQPVIIPG
jgi:regulator of chromosome condensation